jgi:hypothetical protein
MSGATRWIEQSPRIPRTPRRQGSRRQDSRRQDSRRQNSRRQGSRRKRPVTRGQGQKTGEKQEAGGVFHLDITRSHS